MAVEQRIRSSVPGPEINRFRQLLVFDRFLARIFRHFAESVILKATFSFRGTHAVPEAVPAPASEWALVYERMAREDELPWATVADVHRAAASFLDHVLSGGPGTWSPSTRSWGPP